MNITELIKEGTTLAVKDLYKHEILPNDVTMNVTRKEFDGDYSVVVFPYTKAAKKKPEQIGEEVGKYLVGKYTDLESFNVIKGFLNLKVSDEYWNQYLEKISTQTDFGRMPANGKKIMIEFSSPNTNKPLHLGHIRNILLGWSCSKIYEAIGYDVTKVQVVNDRGIAICKSMLAWQKYGEGATPASVGMKSDHFVGHWYVEFEKHFQAEYKNWQKTITGQFIFSTKKGKEQTEDAFFKKYKQTYFNENSIIGKSAKAMLLKWEAGDEDVVNLWKKMNGWVYDGFEVTYKDLGVAFDKLYYESNTYLLGKSLIEKHLSEGIFYKKEDGSVWIDLEDAKLDHKLVLRSDGTSVYMTQDIGTAQLRFDDFGAEQMVYVVADEQDYHFKVLFEIMKRLGAPFAEGMHHLSYGMIELTTGKMKSREGTIVDADDLMKEVIAEAKKSSEEIGTLTDLPEAEKQEIYKRIGMAALKFFIIKVNPKKRMVFNPAESVDLQGQTGPYIQYSYVRIKGILQRASKENVDFSLSKNYKNLETVERDLLLKIYSYQETLQTAAKDFDPSLIANYCFDLAKLYSRFWQNVSIFGTDDEAAKAFRLKLSKMVGVTLKSGMELLGIEMPDKM